MTKKTINLWILFAVSIVISALLISVFVKALKLVLMAILVLALTPVVFFILRRFFPAKKDSSDKLGKRD
ncbi:hypothetical protein [Pontibacter akesuensis]|uniref:Uncharacterized protein n=1 Tax=Pontibacter akesuensis TaxID=388950 RepID=A0A1I7IDF6_9BACT|nr:hypothetical protein [Pontibacter akesuensis]GHA66612.1 hypothetical protein GCM10007389_19590 [Pontibacter akesuensis]SFU70977.1 hypothetical protein SAMN04487941_2126 [Pontibacter akesuensis]